MEFISAREAAGILNVAPNTVTQWCVQGRVPGAKRVSGVWLIPDTITLDDIDRPKMGRPSKETQQEQA